MPLAPFDWPPVREVCLRLRRDWLQDRTDRRSEFRWVPERSYPQPDQKPGREAVESSTAAPRADVQKSRNRETRQHGLASAPRRFAVRLDADANDHAMLSARPSALLSWEAWPRAFRNPVGLHTGNPQFLNPNKASSKRSLTPTFSNTVVKYAFTVASDIPMEIAISLFFRPCTSKPIN